MISKQPFGKAIEYQFENGNGIKVSVLNYGCTVRSIMAPDQKGEFTDIVLGFDKFQNYLSSHPYFGAVVGRYANRIANGEFSLDGKDYKLAINNGPNHIHGGIKGFDKQYWKADMEGNAVVFSYSSPHLEEGFPGKLDVKVRYELDDENRLIIDYEAKTNQTTVLNLTNHAYFNLGGSGSIEDHEIEINASNYTPVNENLIPTGVLQPVEGTPFDFRKSKPISRDIGQNDEQLEFGAGYDHNYVLDATGADNIAAKVIHPQSGRYLEVYTDEPGIQLYTGNWLEGDYEGKNKQSYGKRTGFCLETQHFPDSPNQPNFPSTTLKPGEVFKSRTVYKFGVRR